MNLVLFSYAEWSLFIGRFHPLIVHLPIGIIVFAALLKGLTFFKKDRVLGKAFEVALLSGIASAILAAVSGYLLSADGGYDPETLIWHKWMGFSLVTVTVATWIIWRKQKPDVRLLKLRLSDWLMLTAIVLLFVGGHKGGSLTHGRDYLTMHMPSVLQKVLSVSPVPVNESLPEIEAVDSAFAFTDIIQPLINTKCIKCHNPLKAKGSLDLSSAEGIAKGGSSGPSIVAGDWEASELIQRVTLPESSSKFMPSDNLPPLTPVEISLLKWWVTQGADFKKNIFQMGTDERTKYLLSVYLGISTEDDKEIVLPEVLPLDAGLINSLKEAGLGIRRITSESNLIEVSFVMLENDPPEQILNTLKKLDQAKAQIFRLNVKNCKLNTESVGIITGFMNLTKLNLQGNGLTDDMITGLSNLKNLSYLNIGQNHISDKSADIFQRMGTLTKINLWQTDLTTEGDRKSVV